MDPQIRDSFLLLFKEIYKKRLEYVLKQETGAEYSKHSAAALFEMSRMNNIVEQGFEEVASKAAEVGNPDKIEFKAYAEDGQIPKSKVIKIENDIPLVRGGKPFVYEAKRLRRS